MKVNVTQASDLKFKRWQRWSDWIDISIFETNLQTFLIQMRVSRHNKKIFRTVEISGLNCSATAIGDLTPMKKDSAVKKSLTADAGDIPTSEAA